MAGGKNRRNNTLHQSSRAQPASQGGFTLIEIVVAIVVISSLSLLLVVAYPRVRQQQQLIIAQQQLQGILREIQQAAINEERDPNCLQNAAVQGFEERHCSNLGIAFTANTVRMFADTTDDDIYSTTDTTIRTVHWPANVSVQISASPQSILFQATPPSVAMFVNGVEEPDSTTMELHGGSMKAILRIYSYGQVEHIGS